MLLLLCPRIRELRIWGQCVSLILKLLKITLSKEYHAAKHPDLVVDLEHESDHTLPQGSETPSRRLRLKKTAMLQNLVHFDVSAGEIPSSNFKFFRTLLELPSLQHLSLGALRGGSGATMSDLKVELPCRQLKVLKLMDCRLRTSEVSSVVQCCPNLLEFRISWGPNLSMHSNEDDPLRQDYCVRFGDMGHAIASYAPHLKTMRIDAIHGTISTSCQSPYTISKALQALQHLEELRLTFGAVYGDDAANPSQATLGETVPKTVNELHVSRNLAWHNGEWLEDRWPDLQIADLYQFLQDDSFTQLSFIRLELGNVRERGDIDEVILARHGWVIIAADEWSCEFENRGRA